MRNDYRNGFGATRGGFDSDRGSGFLQEDVEPGKITDFALAKKDLENKSSSWADPFPDRSTSGPIMGVITSDWSDWLVLLTFFILALVLPALCLAFA